MNKLLYHRSANHADISPFDDAILKIASGKTVKIVSPYIGLRYLQRLKEISSEWRLISDLEAWLKSISVDERANAFIFIKENVHCIHHYQGIHAKTVIGPLGAYLGSANMTMTGVLNRTELGIYIEEFDLLEELHQWFDDLWKKTSPPLIHEILFLCQEIDKQAIAISEHQTKLPQLTSDAQKVHARLSNKWQDGIPALEPGKKRFHLDLEHATKAMIEALANEGFTLKESFNHLLKFDKSIKVRDVYFELLAYCAALPRSAFSSETENRLLYSNGIYFQSTLEPLKKALKPYDLYLTSIIESLRFNEPRRLPDENHLRQITNLKPSHQKHATNGLLDSGLLIEEKNLYVLNRNFKWTSRFKLFELGHAAWQKLIKQAQITHHPIPADEIQNSTAIIENPFPDQTNTSHIYAGYTSQKKIKHTSTRPSDNSKTQAIETPNKSTHSTTQNNKETTTYARSISSPTLTTTHESNIQKNTDSIEKIDTTYLLIIHHINKTSPPRFKTADQLINYFTKNIPRELRSLAIKLITGKIHGQPNLLNLGVNKESVILRINNSALPLFPITNKYITQNPHITNRGEQFSPLQNRNRFHLTNETTTLINSIINEITEKSPQRKSSTERPFGTPSEDHRKKLIDLRIKADHIFTELINTAIEYGNPIPIDSASPTTKRINQRLLFLSIQLSKIDRESVGDIPRIIQIQTINEHKPPYKIIHNTKYTQLLDDYPNAKNALIKGYFVIERV